MNQVSSQPHGVDTSHQSVVPDNVGEGNSAHLLNTLNSTQCQQLISLLTSHLTITAATSGQLNDHSESSTYHTGTCFSASFQQPSSINQLWIVDSGASKHICSSLHAFTSLRPIQNSYVTLPNKTSIPVSFIGDIFLNADLTLHDVLYVPQFNFNLLSVSALAKSSSLMIVFFPDQFLIQEIHNQKTIGKGSKLEDLYVLDPSTPVLQNFNSKSVTQVHHVSAHI